MTEASLIDAMKLLSVAILVGGAAIGSATGVGGVGAKLIESTARQPSEAGMLQNKAFLMAGMLDAIPILAVALALLILFGDPLS
ncbi:MAG: F0F1 ATP synthase subunit C [Gammaproteobacteria bacterium]|jgi:F-type H+-transporting ATPase subunit c|nr:F0F1 ATP synthase subunit C [Gammaproteobacteria bacterium]MDP6731367.1 F0F1 ATP synthase subunit C [Gammaproteobacteria bacterium]